MRYLSFLIALLFTASVSHAQTSSSPALVIHLFRHGARAPLHTTYAQGWDDSELGQLTPVGERQHYLLGRALADQYPELLGKSYDPTKIYSRAATQERIIESLQSQLDGVYNNSPSGNITALSNESNYPTERAVPPFESPVIEQIDEKIGNSEAIPGGYTPRASNLTSDEGGVTLLDPTQVCFNLVDNIIENVLEDESIQLWKDLALTRKTLDDAGINVRTPYDLGTLGDALVCDYYANKTLPGNIDPNSETYLNTTFARNWYFVQALWGAKQQRQLLSVPLFNYILKYFDEKAAGTTDYQFMFLSTAETNLLDMLATLDIVTADCLKENYLAELAGKDRPNQNCNYTDFAASILVEFYNNDGSQSVVFKYNNVPIPICNGKTECAYDDFKNLIRKSTNDYTPADYRRDCLGRSLPVLESVLQRAGDAVTSKVNGVKDDFEDVVDEIKGEYENAENFFEDAGEDLSDHLHDFGEDISDGFHDLGENIHDRFDNFLDGDSNHKKVAAPIAPATSSTSATPATPATQPTPAASTTPAAPATPPASTTPATPATPATSSAPATPVTITIPATVPAPAVKVAPASSITVKITTTTTTTTMRPANSGPAN